MVENFDWISGLIGGAIIGLAASLLLLIKGKVFGITGILSGAIFNEREDSHWRIAIIFGLIFGAWLVHTFSSDYFQYEFKGKTWMMILAGFLVGFGTRLGSGCTSGHGICGLPRFSIRSLVAVLTFMFTGAVTVYIFRHVLHLN